MMDAGMQPRILEIIAGILRVPVVMPADTPQSLPGWDSANHLNIIVAVEQEYGIRFTDEAVLGISSAGDIVSIAAALRAGSGG